MIKPVADYILIEPIEKDGALIMPETSKEVPTEGKVVSMGMKLSLSINPTDRGFPTVLNEGDVVIYKKWEGTEVEDKGKKYILIQEEHILATKE
jgi:chaperonin GroES